MNQNEFKLVETIILCLQTFTKIFFSFIFFQRIEIINNVSCSGWYTEFTVYIIELCNQHHCREKAIINKTEIKK